MGWRDWHQRNRQCPDKFEPRVRQSAADQVIKEVTPAIRSYFESALLKDFKTTLAYNPETRTHVVDVEFISIKGSGNQISKQVRLMPDLPSSSEILDGFEKQVLNDKFVKPFLRSDFLENME